MRRVYRLALVDLSRTWTPPRTLVVLVVQLLVAYLATSYVRAMAYNTRLRASAFDVHAAGLNSWALVNYLLLVTFVFHVADTVIGDKSMGWAAVTLGRAGGVGQWWFAKVVAVVISACMFQMSYLLMCVGVGRLWAGLAVSRVASPLASASSIAGGRLFAVVAPGADMLLRESMLVAYETLAFAAIAVLVLTLSQGLRHASIAPASVFGISVIDYVLLRQFDAWAPFSLGRRLLESTHAPVPELRLAAVPWSSSIAIFSAIWLAGLLIGSRFIRARDL